MFGKCVATPTVSLLLLIFTFLYICFVIRYTKFPYISVIMKLFLLRHQLYSPLVQYYPLLKGGKVITKLFTEMKIKVLVIRK